MVRELNLYFTHLRKEEKPISFEHIDQFKEEEELNFICYCLGTEI